LLGEYIYIYILYHLKESEEKNKKLLSVFIEKFIIKVKNFNEVF
jgi:hypothetical protein